MKLFKQKYSVCAECQVHFEPATGSEIRWGRLCPAHRKPIMEKDLRRDAVLSWAGANWEKLELMYKQEREQQMQFAAQELGKLYMESPGSLGQFGSLGSLGSLGIGGLQQNKK